MALRLRAGETVYAGSFMSHWLDTLLYYQAPWWVFVVCYTVFGAAVVGSWFWVSPRPFTSLTDQGSDPGCPGRLSNRRSLVYRIAAWLKSLLQRRPGSGER